ncbi:MAG: hypothetical protein LBD31_03915 [Treponema sp.]|jgi:hypothetical protein|nr:hypothetical protein [Treponema sp.]
MSDAGNPYASPETEINAVKPLAERILTENTLFYLKGASFWLRLVGIAGFVFLGLMAVNFITLIAAFKNLSIPGMEALGSSLVLGIFLVAEVVSFFPVVFVFQFGKKLRSYLHSGNDADLEHAFRANKSLWTFIGVLTLISMGLFGISMLIAIAGSVISAALG